MYSEDPLTLIWRKTISAEQQMVGLQNVPLCYERE